MPNTAPMHYNANMGLVRARQGPVPFFPGRKQAMTVSIQDFWKLIIDSRLLSPEQCHLLGTEFAGVNGAVAQANAKSLAQFLISRNALSNYQSDVLLAGHAGPFFYGDYKVYDRI